MIYRKLRENGQKNVFYLPFASEIQKEKEYKKTYEISFIGTYSPFRENLLSHLKGFDLNIWGDPRWQNCKLKFFVKAGRISQNKMKKIIEKTKINLNIHYNVPKEGANLRNFEVTGSGSFLLTDYVKTHEDLFQIGKEIVCYSSLRDMVAKTRYFLDQEKEREAIAKRGFARAKQDHNYKKRIKQMLSVIYRK